MKEIVIAGIPVKALTEEDAIDVTPELAKELMDQDNKNFRRVSQSEVKRHKNAMTTGSWFFNGDSIAINKDGLVKDGQHRLLGCIESEMPLRTFPILIENDMNIDNKKKLSFDKILAGLGYANTTALAATAKILCRHHKGIKNFYIAKYEIDNNELMQYFESHPEILESFNFTMTYYSKCNVPHSALASFFHVTKMYDSNMAIDFVRKLSLPIGEYERLGITEFNALYHLKRFLMKDTKDEKTPLPIKLAVMIKAWNYWRDEATCQRLLWRVGGSNPEPFPEFK